MDGDTLASTAVAWSPKELQKIAGTDDLHISPFREDGETYGTPTWIWSVVVDGDLYVRGYNGQQSRWYQAAVRQKSRPHSRGRHDERRPLRARRWSDQRSNRRCVPSEVPGQPVFDTDDRYARACGDRASAAAEG